MEYNWHGPEQLRASLIETGTVQPHPKNVRKGNVDVLARSIQRYGQMAPIVVQQSTGNIIKGNHTWKAIKLLGWPYIAATMADVDDDTAYGYLLADNKASDLAEYDKEALARNLGELADAGKLTGTLWTADEMDDLQAAIGTIETLAQEFKGDYSDDPVDRAKRMERELTRVAPKMREVPIVVTVEQHTVFMSNIKVLQDDYKTGGAIETILVAVQREADRVRAERPNAPQPGAGAFAVPAPQPAPVPAAQPDLAAPAPDVTVPTALPNGKAEVWKLTGQQVWRTFQAAHQDSFPRDVTLGIIRAHNPEGGELPIPVMERRRCVTHLVDAVIDSPLRLFTMDAIKSIINRVTEAEL